LKLVAYKGASCPVSTILLRFFRCRFAIPVAAAVAYLYAYGTEFSYVIFTEQRNFTTVKPATGERQRNGGNWASSYRKSGLEC